MPSAPATQFQLIALLLFILPGVVHAFTLERLEGPSPSNRDTTVRVLSALTFSTLLALVYLPILGPWGRSLLSKIASGAAGRGTWVAASVWCALVFFLLPGALALLRHRLPRVKWFPATYDPTPSAWDYAFRDSDPCFVRVLLTDGRLVGGFFGPNSFAAGYPDPHEIFLEDVFEVDPGDASFGNVLGTQLWIHGDHIVTLEFVAAEFKPRPVKEGSEDVEDPQSA